MFVIYIVTVSNVSNIDSNPICEVLSRSLNAAEWPCQMKYKNNNDCDYIFTLLSDMGYKILDNNRSPW